MVNPALAEANGSGGPARMDLVMR